MTSRIEQPGRGRNRVSNACQRCRKHKIKCSGTVPCHTCNKRGYRCEFDSNEKRVVISESTLRDLRNRLDELEKQKIQPQTQEQATESMTVDHGVFNHSDYDIFHHQVEVAAQTSVGPTTHHEQDKDDALLDGSSSRAESAGVVPAVLSNPLVSEQPNYLIDSSGAMRYLGHSSTWSFTQQLLQLTHHSPHFTPSAELAHNGEGATYAVEATPLSLLPQDFAGLPSLELSLFYVQSVKFRTAPLYHLFDEDDFVSRLSRFYDSMTMDVQDQRLWYVHYLLIMAFGKAFNAQSTCCLAGSEFFNRALRLLPDVTFLCKEPIHSTEILCCIALYLQSIDHRNAAHLYVGQAFRMAQTHGLYANMQASAVGSDLVNRCRRIWWTVYTLDRRLCSSFGVPCSFSDQEVTARYPNFSDPASMSAIGQTLHIRICQLIGRVIGTVYSSADSTNQTFLATAQEVLRGIAPLADELVKFADRCMGEISRVSANLSLAYHQCIMIASRPLLFHLLKSRLGSPNPARDLHLSSSMKGLVQVGIDSAVQAAMTLSRLKEHELIESFLPFDLETAFSAALVLVVASSVHPKLLPRENWLDSCHSVFEYMSVKGNALAALRKAEIEQLAQIRHNLKSVRSRRRPLANTDAASSEIHVDQISPTAVSIPDYSSLPSLGDPFFDDWIADDGFSGAQILDLADALNAQDLMF